MRNPILGRRVLDHVTEHPGRLDMDHWGYHRPVCGTVACLGGWAMILAGYEFRPAIFADSRETISYTGTFHRPDGSLVDDPAWEAAELLGLTDDEYLTSEPIIGDCGEPDYCTLFASQPIEAAIARFRAMVEKAEAAPAGK